MLYVTMNDYMELNCDVLTLYNKNCEINENRIPWNPLSHVNQSEHVLDWPAVNNLIVQQLVVRQLICPKPECRVQGPLIELVSQ